MDPIRIVITDDHRITRQGLHSLLSTEPDLLVVGEAGSGREAIELTAQLKPDILLLDLMLPDFNGLEVARVLRQRVSETRILMLTMHSDEPYVLEALNNGAMGYVLKDASLDILAFAVRTVASGNRYLCPPLSERAINAYMERQASGATEGVTRDGATRDGVTRREREILQLAAQSLTSSMIAERLFLSVRTVETHRARAMKKLNLRSQADLFQYAVQTGLISKKSDNT
jgi:DNA-binding NarL/FixJ family response regulator